MSGHASSARSGQSRVIHRDDNVGSGPDLRRRGKTICANERVDGHAITGCENLGVLALSDDNRRSALRRPAGGALRTSRRRRRRSSGLVATHLPWECQAVATAPEKPAPEPPAPRWLRSPKSGKDWTKDRSDARNLRNRQASRPRLRSRRDETRNVRGKHKQNHS